MTIITTQPKTLSSSLHHVTRYSLSKLTTTLLMVAGLILSVPSASASDTPSTPVTTDRKSVV